MEISKIIHNQLNITSLKQDYCPGLIGQNNARCLEYEMHVPGNLHTLFFMITSIFRFQFGPFLFSGQFQPGNVLRDVLKFQ